MVAIGRGGGRGRGAGVMLNVGERFMKEVWSNLLPLEKEINIP